MNDKIEYLKLTVATLFASFAKILGGASKEIFVLLVFIAADTIIGWCKAIKNNKWKSTNARLGLMGKIVELILIACLNALDRLFNTDMLKYIGIYYFIICEASSILENYAQINKNLPEGLIDILLELKKNFAGKIIKIVKDLANNSK